MLLKLAFHWCDSVSSNSATPHILEFRREGKKGVTALVGNYMTLMRDGLLEDSTMFYFISLVVRVTACN